MKRNEVFSPRFPFQPRHFPSWNDASKFAGKGSTPTEGWVGRGWLRIGIRENWIHEKERERERGNAVHFNSRFLNLLSLTSIFTLALHFISSLGFLPFGKSLQDEYPANPSRIHPRLFVLFSIQRTCSFASTPLYSRPRFRFPFSRLLS